jgi:large subunit ribosomal protein L13
MKYTIDAAGKKLGRVATEAAQLLMGKETTAFARNTPSHNEVEVINVGKASITDKKKEDKRYLNFSGYPGGLRVTKMKRVIEKLGNTEVFKDAISGMLPKNKLRSVMMKHLKISE